MGIAADGFGGGLLAGLAGSGTGGDYGEEEGRGGRSGRGGCHGLEDNAPREQRPNPHPNSSRTVQTAMIMAAASAINPAGTACLVFRMPTAPKYTAIT